MLAYAHGADQVVNVSFNRHSNMKEKTKKQNLQSHSTVKRHTDCFARS